MNEGGLLRDRSYNFLETGSQVRSRVITTQGRTKVTLRLISNVSLGSVIDEIWGKKDPPNSTLWVVD